MGKRKMSAKFKASSSAWRSHLNEYRKSHPKMSLKQQMKGASKTYKKSKSSRGINIQTTKFNVNVKPRASKKKTKRTKYCKCNNCKCDPCKCTKKRPKRTRRRSRRKTSRWFGFK